MKYFLNEAATPSNPNISPIKKSIIYDVLQHIVLTVLPVVFGFAYSQKRLKSKYRNKKMTNELLLRIINENAEDLRNYIQTNASQVHLNHDMTDYLLPISIKYMNYVINEKLLSDPSQVYIEYSFQTDNENLTDFKPATKIRGEAEYADYYPDQLSLRGHITINIQDILTLDLYEKYIKNGISGLYLSFLQNNQLKEEILSTIRHETQHAYQLYNSCFFNFYKYVSRKKTEGADVTPKLIDDIFHDEISIDISEGKNFTYFENEPMENMSKKDNENLNIKGKEEKDYYYTNTEAPVRLNDFIIAFVRICKMYSLEREEVLELFFSLIRNNTGKLMLDVVEGDQHLLNDIAQNIVDVFSFIPLVIAKEFATKMAKNSDVAYNFPFIEDIIKHSDSKFRKYYIMKMYSKIKKEFDMPSL